MSLLTDKDFLLHSLHLAYLRRVLPSHAPSSALAGHSPYNLLSFPPSSELAGRSLYLAASPALLDEGTFPELSSGRNSPPLALQLGRGGGATAGEEAGPAATDGKRTKRRGGPGQLGYTQTIVGKGRSGVANAGMRVEGGRSRTWKGKGKLAESEGTLGEDGEGEQQSRRPCIDPFLHAPSASASPPAASTAAGSPPRPPNVVIHSPILTPLVKPRITSSSAFQALPTPRPPGEAEPSGEDLSGSPSSPPYPSDAPRTRFASHTEEYDPTHPIEPSSPSDFPSRPLFQASQSPDSSTGHLASAEPSAPPSPGPSLSVSTPASALSHSITASSPSGSPPSAFATPFNASVPYTAGVSVASSGVSLYGGLGSSSRFTRLSSSLTRERSDSEADSLAPIPPPPPPAPPSPPPIPIAAAEAPSAVPVFQLPPGLRVRERRRVNLRPGGLNLSQLTADPSASEAAGAAAATPQPVVSGALEQMESRRSRSEIPRTSTAAPSAEMSIPPVNGLAPPPPSSPGSQRSRSRSRTSSSPSRQQPIFFPPRAVYVRQAQKTPPAPGTSKSSLSALFAPSPSSEPTGAGADAKSNPFARLYSTLISRTAITAAPLPPTTRRRYGPPPPAAPSDVLLLTVFFPFSSTPSKGIKLPIKRHLSAPVTVEEVIGAGLYSFWEEGREPALDDGDAELPKRAREGEETARWELRIVEDEEGMVDEDFPALDRTRAITAFSFTEFAIVKASEQQVSDNLAKQSNLVRRPSRILSTPAAPPPTSSSGTQLVSAASASAPTMQTHEVPLRILIPDGLTPSSGSGKDGVVELKVDPAAFLHDVLRQLLSQLSPPPSAPPLLSSDFALLLRLSDSSVLLPLDRTVEASQVTSTGGIGSGGASGREVELVPKNRVGGVGIGLGVGAAGGGRRKKERDEDELFRTSTHQSSPDHGRTGNRSESRQQRDRQAASELAPYQHYNVFRKLPLTLGGRHPRTIAIDGDYLHFMPTDPRFGAAQAQHHGLGGDPTAGSGRTTSIHVSNIIQCKVSRRSASSFKIVVHTPRNIDKRYDFEAESPERAREIVEGVREVTRVYGAGRQNGRR